MRITDDILYVGVNDHNIDLFEGQYIVPNGMAYNSYVINDEKIAVMDTVDAAFGDEWLKNIADVLNGATPDYLIIQHMEPDHSANIQKFLEVYPNIKVVGNAKTFTMIGNFFRDLKLADENKLEVKNKDTLTLGKHELTFVFAPMVHWPEVMVTYDSKDKVLFSADGFGKFGALDAEEDWDCEARRYYVGIVGKYGAQVQNLLKVAATLDIQTICPLHGPVLTENLEQSVLRVLYVIQQEHLDFIPQSRYSMQDRKSSESSSVHLLFQLRQKNIVQQQDLPQSYVLYSE